VVQYIRTTPNIDQHIMTIDKAICRHIAEFGTSPRGMVSLDVLVKGDSMICERVDHCATFWV